MLKKILSIFVFSFIVTITSANAAYVRWQCEGDSGVASTGADDVYAAMEKAMSIAASICGGKPFVLVGVSNMVSSPGVLPITIKPTQNPSIPSATKGALPIYKLPNSVNPLLKPGALPPKKAGVSKSL